MKKVLVGLLITLSLSLVSCGTKLTEAKINDSDSTQLKTSKEVYNICLNYYNLRDVNDKLFDAWEREAKAHPKDGLLLLHARSLANALEDVKSSEKGDNKKFYKELVEDEIAHKKDVKPCSNDEFKDFKKVSQEDCDKHSRLYFSMLDIAYKSDDLKDFTKKFIKLESELYEKFSDMKITSKKELNGEEFLKLNYRKAWQEVWKKQGETLKEMKRKIDNMK